MTAAGMKAAYARAVPVVFVLLWSSGFVVARLVRPYTEPESFISLRFVISALLLGGIAQLGGASWPRTAQGWGASLVAGMLMQGAYVGGVFWAVRHGLPAGLAALIAGLQPLLTSALAGPFLGERVTPRRWLGVVIGFVGAALVIAPHLVDATSAPFPAIAACVVAMGAMTLGTIWQKRIGATVDLRVAATIQFVGGLLVTLPIAMATERQGISNHIDVWIGLAWGVIVLSVATTQLLLGLIRRGAVAQVTSLLYLTPPVTALMALALFGEVLVPIQVLGMAIAALGVFVANRN